MTTDLLSKRCSQCAEFKRALDSATTAVITIERNIVALVKNEAASTKPDFARLRKAQEIVRDLTLQRNNHLASFH